MRAMTRIWPIYLSCLLLGAFSGCANQPNPDLVGRTSGDGNRHYQPQAVECEQAAKAVGEAETDKAECRPPEDDAPAVAGSPPETAYPD